MKPDSYTFPNAQFLILICFVPIYDLALLGDILLSSRALRYCLIICSSSPVVMSGISCFTEKRLRKASSTISSLFVAAMRHTWSGDRSSSCMRDRNQKLYMPLYRVRGITCGSFLSSAKKLVMLADLPGDIIRERAETDTGRRPADPIFPDFFWSQFSKAVIFHDEEIPILF